MDSHAAPVRPHTVALANGGVLSVAAVPPDSVRLEAWDLEARMYSAALTSRDIYNLSNEMVNALHRARICARAASPPAGSDGNAPARSVVHESRRR